MAPSIDWIQTLIENHRSLEYIIVCLGVAFGGELALFFLGFLMAQGVVSLSSVAVFGFLGSFLPNGLWYMLGNVDTVSKVSSYRRTKATFLMITDAVERISRGSHTVALIIIKFLVGTPVLLILYTQKTGLKLRQFILSQSVAVILSMFVLLYAGFLSGKGFSYLSKLFQNAYAAFGFLVFMIFIISLFQVWLEKRLTEKEEQGLQSR